MTCLVGCINNFVDVAGLKAPLEGHTLAPWVTLSISGEEVVTVGNESAPNNGNHAVIKSFEFGGSTGAGIRCEIMDEQGGSFHQFVDNLTKCISQTSADFKVQAQWGWIVSYCDGTTTKLSSPTVTLQGMNIEVLFSEGKVKFILNATDTMQIVFGTRNNKNQGSSSQKMPLKQAIRKLFNDEEPKIQVKFLRKNKDGTESEWNFLPEFGPDGPQAIWEPNQEHKLAAALDWLQPFTTDQNKGIYAMWDSTADVPTVVFWESSAPDCTGVANYQIIGTWIVNGGNCSNVISFNPNINFAGALQGFTTGGNTGGAGSPATVEKPASCAGQPQGAGVQQNIPIASYAWDVYGPKQATKKTSDAQDKHNEANRITLGALQAITAELRFQGDPSFPLVDTKTLQTKRVALVVINPFYLFSNGNGCGDWLALPGCNDILSNKAWLPTGVHHSIKEGSYVTTLNLTLTTDSIDFNTGVPWGGAGSSGYLSPGC